MSHTFDERHVTTSAANFLTPGVDPVTPLVIFVPMHFYPEGRLVGSSTMSAYSVHQSRRYLFDALDGAIDREHRTPKDNRYRTAGQEDRAQA
jgi:hypothetical protein